MCGIYGFIGAGLDDRAGIAARMAKVLHHRGPDDGGTWYEDSTGLVLGQRRLAIVDLSEAGHQPMESRCGRYMLVFNGEIYNHLDLRRRYESLGHVAWRGHSDTETLLEGFTRFGVRATLQEAVGMFAFAVWDQSERRLVLGRDRAGEKPLYVMHRGHTLVFASELKALVEHPRVDRTLDRQALAAYMHRGYVPAPLSIYAAVRKLEPGTVLSFDPARGETAEEVYWSAVGTADAARRAATRSSATPEEHVQQLDTLLRDAIGKQMLADVPLGAFLSGGIDSSTVVGIMQSLSAQPVRTFSIGFHEQGYDEAGYARAVAAHLGTAHTELYVSDAEARAVVPRLPDMYDEPFGDSSQIPTFLVSQLARASVTVSLSGDAGDELFGGYNRYRWADRMWRRLGSMPLAARRALASGMLALSPRTWSALARSAGRLAPAELRHGNAGDKVYKLAELIGARDQSEMYLRMISHWRDVPGLTLGVDPTRWMSGSPAVSAGGVEAMMLQDFLSYLPDDILAKVDRAAMATSLETRVPFLDHRVIEFAWSLPTDRKLRGGTTKWILRGVLDRYVPRRLVERPKMGFGVPIDTWLRGPLREWGADLLDPRRLRDQGLLDAGAVGRRWRDHQDGTRNHQHDLWNVLMFQAWLARWHPG